MQRVDLHTNGRLVVAGAENAGGAAKCRGQFEAGVPGNSDQHAGHLGVAVGSRQRAGPRRQVDGTEDKDVMVRTGGQDVPYKGQQFLLARAIPNFYFHVSTAYDILRHNGLEVGKRDYLGNTQS